MRLLLSILFSIGQISYGHGTEDHTSNSDPQSQKSGPTAVSDERTKNLKEKINDTKQHKTMDPIHDKKSAEVDQAALGTIGERFRQNILPIFEKSCANCHGVPKTPLPWYSSLPAVGHLIEDDMLEAKKHLDFRKGFPFEGHGDPEGDLKAIYKSIDESTMPPLRYKVMHWGSSLSEEEKFVVLTWVRESLDLLNVPLKKK